MTESFLQIDLPAILVSILASVICSILGSFLVLRKQAMMGDTLSHVVLPGIALAFIITGNIAPTYMAIGALIACLTSVLLIKILTTFVKIESGASMGTVFTIMFALGILLLETKVGTKVHLDTHHALYGALELTYWPAPISLQTIPHQITSLLAALILTIALIILLFKELKLSSFDPLYAQTIGIPKNLLSIILMSLVALATVACFQAVGSILVIALFICPAATARMITDDFKAQIYYAAGFGLLSAVLGYVLAVFVPAIFGYEHALNAGGMIGLTSGLLLFAAILFAPDHGYITKKAKS